MWGDGFEIETLIHTRVAKARLSVSEVPSFEHLRIHGVSNLNTFRDGIRVLRAIFTERRASRRPARPAGQVVPLRPVPDVPPAPARTSPVLAWSQGEGLAKRASG